VLASIRPHPDLGSTILVSRPRESGLLRRRYRHARTGIWIDDGNVPFATEEKPVRQFNVGEVVERREFSNTTRGRVVDVTANG
jgi:hypothetical protein